MKVGIIDAEIIGKNKHRFPNLACMKLSSWHKKNGDDVRLITNYNDIGEFDKVYISKVFTKTSVPDGVLESSNVQYGGTGFYYDKAPFLPPHIEHAMPDYHLYDNWINDCIAGGAKESEFTYYKDYSVGFVTRGCFRKCQFCVNKNSNRSLPHSPPAEFLDPHRKKMCLLDDNFLACSDWKNILLGLQALNQRFQFKQGLDERLLTDEKCELLFNSKYDGDYIFAFDNVGDSVVIENKLALIRKYTNKVLKFYVFCAYDRNDQWDNSFWLNDIESVLQRVKILGAYRCKPYIMRYDRYIESPYRKIYVDFARWCNQPGFFWNMSFVDFCDKRNDSRESIHRFINEHPEFENAMRIKYFNNKL